MAVITLTTDWRNHDYYVGAVKGKIVSRDPSTTIVDISHQITSFNVMQAAFVLRNCYAEFPEQTVHVMGVNSILTSKRTLLIIEKDKQYFLCSDSGFPDLLFPNEDKKVYRHKVENLSSNTFVSLNVFVDIAFKIINGELPKTFAEETKDYLQQVPLLPTIEKNQINGSVVYIDSFSNAITNINKETFDRVCKGKPFEIYVQSNHYKISEISNSYSDLPTGELVAIFNSAGLLEIAITNGPASELLSLSINSAIRIKISNKVDSNKLFLSGE